MTRDRILVVGAAGFLGRACASALVSAGFEVDCVDLMETSLPGISSWTTSDVTQDGIPAKLLRRASTLLHFAWSNDPGRGNDDMTSDVRSNVASAVRAFEDAARAGVRRIIYPSSGGTIYGRYPTLPTPETAPVMPIGGYGAGKAAAEFYLHAISLAYGIETCAMRISNPYGPGQYPDRGQGFIATAVARTLRGEPIQVFGTATLSRDYVYIDDVADGFVRACHARELPLVLNLGSGTEHSIDDLIPLIGDAAGCPTNVSMAPARAVDVPRVCLDVSLANQLLGWRPDVSMVIGLQRTVAWIRTVI